MLAGPTVVITDSDLSSDDDEQVLREAGFATVRFLDWASRCIG